MKILESRIRMLPPKKRVECGESPLLNGCGDHP
jgi:hypothetical protein